MNAGTDQITFGAQGVADVQVHLPLVLTDRESSLCLFCPYFATLKKAQCHKHSHVETRARDSRLVLILVYSDEHVRSSYRYHCAG